MLNYGFYVKLYRKKWSLFPSSEFYISVQANDYEEAEFKLKNRLPKNYGRYVINLGGVMEGN